MPGENGCSNAEKSTLLANVPFADFITNVEEFMKSPDNPSADIVLKRFDERHQLYKLLDTNLFQKRQKISSKIDELKQSLQLIEAIIRKKKSCVPMETQFLLSDMCYATAEIGQTDKICLWLGANVMVEYTSDEAFKFLSEELNTCQSKKIEFDDGIEKIKNYITTTEVNMARVYNWTVQKKKSRTEMPVQ